MIKLPVGAFTVSMSSAYIPWSSDEYSVKIKEVTNSSAGKWVKENGCNFKVASMLDINYNYDTEVVVYTEMSDIQATEYTLRFL